MRRTSSVLALCLVLAACGQAPAPVAPSTLPPVDTLSFSPKSVSVKVGETTEVKVMLDIQNRSSQTYQAEITFDPAIVEVVDADDKTPGTQIAVGLYETAVDNTVDAAEGRIRLLGYSLTPGKEVAGQGTLATITFKGKAAGSAKLAFDAAIGESTSKTKIILKGDTKDLVVATSGGAIIVTE